MKCQRCKTDRVATVGVKVGDGFGFIYKTCIDYGTFEGHELSDIGLEVSEQERDVVGYRDLAFRYCLECGQIQGKFPVADPLFDIDGEQRFPEGHRYYDPRQWDNTDD